MLSAAVRSSSRAPDTVGARAYRRAATRSSGVHAVYRSEGEPGCSPARPAGRTTIVPTRRRPPDWTFPVPTFMVIPTDAAGEYLASKDDHRPPRSVRRGTSLRTVATLRRRERRCYRVGHRGFRPPPGVEPILPAGRTDTSAPCPVWCASCMPRNAARSAIRGAIHRRVAARPPGQPAAVASRGLRLAVGC
jgi:hypothetical protein